MTRLEEIERTYCLEKEVVTTSIMVNGTFRKFASAIRLKSMSGICFSGSGKSFDEMEQNCVEVFEIHQELWRKGLLTTKNLN